ncbi:MAG: endonuclease [Candidatus Sumerlaeia bacterium]|nr:endonuclease [Candidatus Sumerlaeia bacterium]
MPQALRRILRGAAALGAFALLSAAASADPFSPPYPPPTGYYDTILPGDNGDAMKAKLNTIITGHTVRSYNAARDILINDVDNVGSGNVKLVYTSILATPAQWNVVYDREHTWPQSRGAGSSPMESDMHHLILCTKSLNSARGNDVYGDVGSTGTVYPGVTANDTSYSVGEVFQVSNNWKGDVARMMFYMDTRYPQLQLVTRTDYPDPGSFPSNTMGYLEDLLRWHTEDPVDTAELRRHSRVYFYQDNRNPYIDNPSYVARVYGGTVASAPQITDLTVTPSVVYPGDNVTVTVNVTDPNTPLTVTLYYRYGTSGPFSTLSMAAGAGDSFSTTSSLLAPVAGTIVQYYIQATDASPESATLPADGAAAPAQYTTASDLPIATGLTTLPNNPDADDTVQISVNVVDNLGAGNITATGYWRLAGGGSFTALPMTNAGGNVFTTTGSIPAQPAGVAVEYYMTAQDGSLNTVSLPAGGASAPAIYIVEEANPYIQIDATNARGKLLLTEIQHRYYNGATKEFAEIVNYSSQGFILDNLLISDNGIGGDAGEGGLKFPAGATIDPYGVVVVITRDEVVQTEIDPIPTASSINGSPVKVFSNALTTRTFNGVVLPQMRVIGGNNPEFASGGDQVVIAYQPADIETYNLADVIDGAGYGSPTGGDVTAWSWAVSNTSNVAATSGTADGIARQSPTDTDSAADWAITPLNTSTTSTNSTPGALPASFLLPEIALVLSGTNIPINEGGTATLNVRLAAAPTQTLTVRVARVSSGARAETFLVQSGALLSFTTTDWNVDKTVTFEKLTDADTDNDAATFAVYGDFVTDADVTVTETDVLSVADWRLF